MLAATLCGCSRGPVMAPVHGIVSLDGKPLAFGVIMLHPTKGQVAQASIGADGAFAVSTFHPGDGAPVGSYRVSVLCYEGHDPQRKQAGSNSAEEFLLGKSLVPLRYTRANSSGLSVDVAPDADNELVLDLRSQSK